MQISLVSWQWSGAKGAEMQATKLIIVLRGFIGCANAYVRACNVAGPSITFSAIYYLHHGMVYIFCYKFTKIKYLQ